MGLLIDWKSPTSLYKQKETEVCSVQGLLLATTESTLCTPLVWVVMALRLTEACDSSKLLLKLPKLLCLGQRPLELDLCNGSKPLWLLCSFLNILQSPKQPGCNEG